MPVRQLLLRHNGDLLDADAIQNAAHRFVAGTVQRGVHHLDRRFFANTGVDLLGRDLVEEFIHHRGADQLDPAGSDRRVIIRHFHIVENIQPTDIAGHFARFAIGHLIAGGAVALVAVVRRRVMAGGNHDARLAAQLAHRKGQHRCRLQFREQIGLHLVGCQHARRFARKHIGFDARIVGDDHRRVHIFVAQIVGKPLRRFAHGVDVHAVVARTDHPAQTGSAEIQLAVKPVADLCLLSVDALQLVYQIGICRRFPFPAFVCFHNAHGNQPPFLKFIYIIQQYAFYVNGFCSTFLRFRRWNLRSSAKTSKAARRAALDRVCARRLYKTFSRCALSRRAPPRVSYRGGRHPRVYRTAFCRGTAPAAP